MKLAVLGLVIAILLFFGCAQQTEQPAQQPALPSQAPAEDTPVAPPAQPPADNVPLPPSTGTGGADTPPPPPPAASGITMAQLAAHNSPSDCWVAYKGNVYDVTSFIPQHKDGEIVIAQYCGTLDFEAGFTAKHGTSKVDKFMEVATAKGEFAG